MTAETTSLRGNSPDIVVLRLGTSYDLEHFLEDCPLMRGSTVLEVAVVQKMCAKAGHQAIVETVDEGLANAHW